MSQPDPLTPPPAPAPVDLTLSHCGRIRIEPEKGLRGWFHPISMALWEQIIGFHLEVTLRWKAESLSYHRWNPKRGSYDTIIPYQETTPNGLSVRADWQDPRNKALLDEYAQEHGREFFPACTIHTHVDAGAFESGTDAHDEKHQAGWHMTIGHLLHKQYDFDCRFRLPRLPKVKAHTSIETAYDLMLVNLFPKDADFGKIKTTLGNKDFHVFLDRVNAKREVYRHSQGQSEMFGMSGLEEEEKRGTSPCAVPLMQGLPKHLQDQVRAHIAKTAAQNQNAHTPPQNGAGKS